MFFKRRILFYSIVAGSFFLLHAAYALDVVLPRDMFNLSIETNNPDPGFYYVDLGSIRLDDGWRKTYILTVDEQGNVVWFHKPPLWKQYRMWRPLPMSDYLMFAQIGGGFQGVVVLDSSYAMVDSMSGPHPYYPQTHLDTHEIMMMPDGSEWRLWMQEIDGYDMSQWLPGASDSMTFAVNRIDHWSADGEMLWEWSSFDHMDMLPPTGRLYNNGLYEDYVEHLHTNSFDFFPNGDLLVSARHVSIIFRVDRETGEVLWRMGGGPLNDFTFINGTDDPDIPLDFWVQHDARILDNGNITVFDNGVHHPGQCAFGREYVIDENAMTATLVWAYAPPDSFHAVIQGSTRQLDNGNYLIGWGGVGNTLIGTEVTPQGNVKWQLAAHNVLDGYRPPDVYRVIKTESVSPAARPYIADLCTDNIIEIYCNWFGHEDEVAAYDIYYGLDPDTLDYFGRTYTGIDTIFTFNLNQTYYCAAQALDADGNVISELSEPRPVNYNMNEVIVAEQPVRAARPPDIDLLPAYPNPFNSTTHVTVDLSRPSHVELQVFDLLGREVAELYSGQLNAGAHPFMFNAGGRASGIYFIRMSSESGLYQTSKITLIK